MSVDLNFREPLNGWRYRGNVYVVGLPMPGFESFGPVTVIDICTWGNGVNDISFKTEIPCKPDYAWHHMRGAWKENEPQTSATYLYDQCMNCGSIAQPWPGPHAFVPDIIELAGAIEATARRQDLPDFPYGFATEDAAIEAAKVAIATCLAA